MRKPESKQIKLGLKKIQEVSKDKSCIMPEMLSHSVRVVKR